MKHYIDQSGVVRGYEEDGSQDFLIVEGMRPISGQELREHLSKMNAPTGSDVDAERDRRIDAGVAFQGVMFQSRATDRENIAGAAQLGFMALIAGGQADDLRWSDPDEDFVWIASDNSLVPMDASTVVEFGKVAAQRKQALIMAGRQLKDMARIPTDYADDKWWP